MLLSLAGNFKMGKRRGQGVFAWRYVPYLLVCVYVINKIFLSLIVKISFHYIPYLKIILKLYLEKCIVPTYILFT